MRVLAFRHAPLEDLGAIREILEHTGCSVQCADLYREAESAAPEDAAGLIFMGGPMCANDDLPFLQRELAIIRDAARRGQPMLGICLGAQLMAAALGGRVYKNAIPEIGWYEIQVTEAGMADPLFCRAKNPQPVFQWHGDTFDLPPGARLLATSEACRNQAFRLRKNSYGLQFHPEMTPAMIEDWQQDAAVCGTPVAPIDPHLHAGPLSGFCEGLVHAWTRLL